LSVLRLLVSALRSQSVNDKLGQEFAFTRQKLLANWVCSARTGSGRPKPHFNLIDLKRSEFYPVHSRGFFISRIESEPENQILKEIVIDSQAFAVDAVGRTQGTSS
jgi:hypothetical protein